MLLCHILHCSTRLVGLVSQTLKQKEKLLFRSQFAFVATRAIF